MEGTFFFKLALLFGPAFFICLFSRGELKAMGFFDLPLTDLSLFELICNELRDQEMEGLEACCMET